MKIKQIIYLLIISNLLIINCVANENFYSIEGNTIYSNDYKIIFEDNLIIDNLLIDNNSLYINTNKYLYFINTTSGNIDYKLTISDIKRTSQTDNYIYSQTDYNIYKINKSSGNIDEKRIYFKPLEKIYSYFGVSGISGITNNYYTNYTNYTNVSLNISEDVNFHNYNITNINKITSNNGSSFIDFDNDVLLVTDRPTTLSYLILNGINKMSMVLKSNGDRTDITQSASQIVFEKNGIEKMAVNISGNISINTNLDMNNNNIINCLNCISTDTNLSYSGGTNNDGTLKRIQINLSATSGLSTGYQKLINVSYNNTGGDINLSNNASFFPYDLNFQDSNNNNLSFFILNYSVNPVSIYVKIDADLSSNQYIYLNYNRTNNITSRSNGYNTFEFFEDCSSGLLTNWSIISGSWVCDNGKIRVNLTSSESKLITVSYVISNGIMEYISNTTSNTSTKYYGSVVRYQDTNNFYHSVIYNTSDTPPVGLMAGKVVSSSWTNSLTSQNWFANTDYFNKIVLNGSNQYYYLLGNNINRTDTNFANGKIGFRVYGSIGGFAYFNNIWVRKYNNIEPSISFFDSTPSRCSIAVIDEFGKLKRGLPIAC